MKVYANRWEGEFFFSFLLHGLSLAILISTKDLVPSGRLRRITLHTNHRKEFLQRGANRELAFFHARIRFNYFYLATIPILHETLQKLVKFQDFSKFHPALTKEKSSILRSINLSKGARNFLEFYFMLKFITRYFLPFFLCQSSAKILVERLQHYMLDDDQKLFQDGCN